MKILFKTSSIIQSFGLTECPVCGAKVGYWSNECKKCFSKI
ncbi:hypothetical protein N9809_05990 [Amylibacter sp.]|nr:hypothetical protein [Amylibacter sp.]MDB2600743.1 hypothetical protein [Amylibacter sp.]MDB4221603.1 hypothetical protein [Amylibacter sp.]